ncbi:MAG TPA: hypothetical protein DCS68_13075, partial [Pantoea agglomerans]|nr:hypothetical protein [Pantoea agglomerans]
MTEQTFLVEIGTEELPPKALRSLAEAFAAKDTDELDAANLSHAEVTWFAAPRRLALKDANLRASHPARAVEKSRPAAVSSTHPAAAGSPAGGDEGGLGPARKKQ